MPGIMSEGSCEASVPRHGDCTLSQPHARPTNVRPNGKTHQGSSRPACLLGTKTGANCHMPRIEIPDMHPAFAPSDSRRSQTRAVSPPKPVRLRAGVFSRALAAFRFGRTRARHPGFPSPGRSASWKGGPR